MSDRHRELEDLRRQQAEADLDILRGLQRRARLARQMGGLGSVSGGLDEREQLALLVQLAGDELPADIVRSIFREVHAATLSLARPARVAFAGPEGGFGQVAAARYFGLGATLLPFETAELALDEVRRRRADFAIFPFESSAEGPLQRSVEALSATELSLAAKVEVVERLSLMGSAGSKVDEIRMLYVHGPDRLAAEKFISSLAQLTVVEVASPLAACQACVGDEAAGALVPQPTGELASLSVIQPDISDRTDYRVRYGLASSRPASRSGSDTTAIVFGVHDEPGALFEVLKHFAERGINLKTIQSRPLSGEAWTNAFYVEVSGHVTDRALVTALEEVKRLTRLLKVLGSFPSC